MRDAPQPWRRSADPPRAKRAKALQQEGAVLLSMQQLAATQLTLAPRVAAVAAAPAASSSDLPVRSSVHTNTQPSADSATVNGLQHNAPQELTAGLSPRDVAIKRLESQAAAMTFQDRAVAVQILQINGFMNYAVWSVSLCRDDQHDEQHADHQAEPGRGTRDQKLANAVETAILFAVACSRLKISVLAIDLHVLREQATCHVMSYCEDLNNASSAASVRPRLFDLTGRTRDCV